MNRSRELDRLAVRYKFGPLTFKHDWMDEPHTRVQNFFACHTLGLPGVDLNTISSYEGKTFCHTNAKTGWTTTARINTYGGRALIASEFHASHPEHQHVWGDFMKCVWATSEQGYKAFCEANDVRFGVIRELRHSLNRTF
jgi:hypothetical protein